MTSVISVGCFGQLDGSSQSCPNLCPSGFYSTGGATACIPTDAGISYQVRICYLVTNVLEGCASPSQGSTMSCPRSCPPGSASPAGATSCTPCIPGQYSSLNGSTTCTPVSEGLFLDHQLAFGVMVAAILGCFGATQGATTSCPTICPAGSFSLGGATSCSICVAGQYSAFAKSSNCSLISGGDTCSL